MRLNVDKVKRTVNYTSLNNLRLWNRTRINVNLNYYHDRAVETSSFKRV